MSSSNVEINNVFQSFLSSLSVHRLQAPFYHLEAANAAAFMHKTDYITKLTELLAIFGNVFFYVRALILMQHVVTQSSQRDRG